MTSNLYTKYISEREGLSEIMEDWGFIHYRITGEECFIADYFVVPERRGTRIGYILAKKVEDLAVDKGCSMMTANVDLISRGAESATKNILNFGYKFAGAQGNIISFYKEL